MVATDTVLASNAKLHITRNNVFDNLPKALGGVGLGDDRNGSAPVLSLEPAGFLASHEHEAGRKVGPAMLDTSIEIVAGHPGHPKVAQDHVVAASREQFERLPPILRRLYMVAVQT
jgi:hypothetical protein